MQTELESLLAFRQESEPANIDVIAAFAPSEHLKLFCVVNSAKKEQFVLASSEGNAKILSVMSGHIETIRGGYCWKAFRVSDGFLAAVKEAVKDKLPGVVWHRNDSVIMRHKVYVSKPSGA